MSSSPIYRLSGLALIAGALLMSISSWFRPAGGELATVIQPFYATAWLLTFVGGLLLLLGFPAMYAYQAQRAGRLGAIGYGLSFIGIAVVEVGTGVLSFFVEPLLAANPATQSLIAQPGGLSAQWGMSMMVVFLVGFLALNLGLIVYGIATLRARVFPRWAAVMIIVGVPAVFILVGLSPVINAKPEVLIFLGLAWCGYSLLANRGAATVKTNVSPVEVLPVASAS